MILLNMTFRRSCLGTEERIEDCESTRGRKAQRCGHSGDVGIECNIPSTAQCSQDVLHNVRDLLKYVYSVALHTASLKYLFYMYAIMTLHSSAINCFKLSRGHQNRHAEATFCHCCTNPGLGIKDKDTKILT